MKKPIRAFSIFIALVLAGCVSTPGDLQLSESHPASPAGPQGVQPPPTPFLMAETNLVGPADGSDPGWYKSPPGTLAELAPDEELKRDGIELPKDLPKTASRSTPKDEAWCGVPPAKSPLLAKNVATAKIKIH